MSHTVREKGAKGKSASFQLYSRCKLETSLFSTLVKMDPQPNYTGSQPPPPMLAGWVGNTAKTTASRGRGYGIGSVPPPALYSFILSTFSVMNMYSFYNKNT